MFSFQEGHISPPGLFVPIHWPFEPIAPWKRKRTPFFTGQPPPYRIFPIRSVNYNFPNIMASGPGRLRCFARRNTANRTAKIGAVPCGSVVTFIQHSQEMLNFWMRHCFSQGCEPSGPHDWRMIAEEHRQELFRGGTQQRKGAPSFRERSPMNPPKGGADRSS